MSEEMDHQEALIRIVEAIADADGDDEVGGLDVDIPHGGYPRQYLRAAARRVLNRDPDTNVELASPSPSPLSEGAE